MALATPTPSALALSHLKNRMPPPFHGEQSSAARSLLAPLRCCWSL